MSRKQKEGEIRMNKKESLTTSEIEQLVHDLVWMLEKEAFEVYTTWMDGGIVMLNIIVSYYKGESTMNVVINEMGAHMTYHVFKNGVFGMAMSEAGSNHSCSVKDIEKQIKQIKKSMGMR